MRTAALLVLALLVAACGLGDPETTAPTTTVPGDPIVYVALGGPETVERDVDSRRRAVYPRILFRDLLPTRTVFTDLATDDSVETVLPALVDDAEALGATDVTLWVAPPGPGGAPSTAERMGDAVARLVSTGATVAATGGPVDDEWVAAARAATEQAGGVYVDVTGADDEGEVARRFATALGR